MDHVPLPPALSGLPGSHTGAAGRLCVYEEGSGPPLLLIHSVNAAASSAEMRPVYDHYKSSRHVFAVDLPGFGLSDRSDREYSIRLMTDAVHDATDHVQARCGPGPIDAVALSLSCEFLARAAVENPGRFRSLSLVSPTGLRGSTPRHGAPGSARGSPFVHRLLQGPGWGPYLYRGLTRPAVIRYFLQKTWGSRDIDETLWAYDVLCARQPGACHAPLYFLSALLFSADIHSVYQAITAPVWVSHGIRGDFTDYRMLDSVAPASWRKTVYPTGALCYFECPDRFWADLDQVLAD